MSVKPIPDGYHTLTPYLICQGAGQAIEFYKQAFGAKEVMRMNGPGDSIAHAEIQIGDSRIMLGDEMPSMGYRSPKGLDGCPVGLCLYVENCDAVFDRAVKAGAIVKRPLDNQFYGDRSGQVIDPFGHVWTIGTHVEDVSEEEMCRRMEAMMAEQGQG